MLTTLVGASALGSVAADVVPTYAKLIVGTLSLLAAVLSGLQTFFKYAVLLGVCDADGADLAMRRGFNYPRGPLEWANEMGLSRVAAVLDRSVAAHDPKRQDKSTPVLHRLADARQNAAAP